MQRGGRPGPALPYDLLAGVVPCRKGWLVLPSKLVGTTLHPEAPEVVAGFAEILDHVPGYSIIAVDVPIGLTQTWVPRGRTCDDKARKLLGWPRLGTVVSPPGRAELAGDAPVPGGVISRYLASRIAEVDSEMQPYRQRAVYAVMSELSFMHLNDNRSLRGSKRSIAGMSERQALLAARLPGVAPLVAEDIPGATRSQLLDAAAVLWSARRIAARAAIRIPEEAEWDDDGLRTEWVY